jgi:hypothetical protein
LVAAEVTTQIQLGFEVGSGRAVEIPLRHMAVTGQTQESGKTTTLEGLIARSGLRAVAYVTKRGESSFRVANPVAPYFLERADWQFVLSLLEASTQTKLKFEQSWIMRASEGARTLQDVRANIQRFLSGVPAPARASSKKRKSKTAMEEEAKQRWIQRPAKGLSGDIYYVLGKYLDALIPQLEELPYSSTLNLAEGLNVMDLRDYEFPLQALVVRSVIDWTRDHGENTINVIPEAWKFAPKQKGSPVRQSAEELIREGGALKNFLWIDSQDLAGVADVLMRQVGVWIFGVQRAKHEIERALDHMPEGLPVRRPRPQDIATLNKGQFYVCFGREMYKVYVQPAWMSAAHAEAIARGEEDVDSAREILTNFDQEAKRDQHKKQIRRGSSTGISEPNSLGRSDSQGDLDRRPSGESAGKVENGEGAVLGRKPDHSGNQNGASTPEEEMNHEGFRQALIEALGTSPSIGDDHAIVSSVRNLRESHDALARRVSALEAKGVPSQEPAPSGAVRAAKAAGSTAASAAEFPHGGVPTLPSIYTYVVERLRKEGPKLLQLAVQEPELRVAIERPVLTMDGKNLSGRLAKLIHEGFFAEKRSAGDVLRECLRRGWVSQGYRTNLLHPALKGIAEMGFLTLEGEAYQAVPGMKVSIVEEKASKASA